MFEIITAAALEYSVKVLVGVLLYLANPYLGYAYGVNEVYRLYTGIERVLMYKKVLKKMNAEKVTKGAYLIKGEKDGEDKDL